MVGEAMVQVVPSDQPLGDLVDGFRICLASGCHSSIGDDYRSCSLRCQVITESLFNFSL
jgi:hypothetical protein